MAEAGVSGQEADTLTGIVAPAGTPKAIVDRLQRDIAKVVAQPDVKEQARHAGLPPGREHAGCNSPTQIKSEMEKWGKVVHAAKLRD